VFRFNPPPGTKVTESTSKGTEQGPARSRAGSDAQPGQGSRSAPKTVGTGWTTVVVAALPAADAEGSSSATRMLEALPKVSGSWGSGHLLRGALFSALLTDDGRLAVGAVSPEALYSALAAR
jgi:hypothetical protein